MAHVYYCFDELSFRLPGFDVWIHDCLSGCAVIDFDEYGQWSVDSVTVQGFDGAGLDATQKTLAIETGTTKYADEFCASVEASLRLFHSDSIEDEIEHAPEPAREYEWGH